MYPLSSIVLYTNIFQDKKDVMAHLKGILASRSNPKLTKANEKEVRKRVEEREGEVMGKRTETALLCTTKDDDDDVLHPSRPGLCGAECSAAVIKSANARLTRPRGSRRPSMISCCN